MLPVLCSSIVSQEIYVYWMWTKTNACGTFLTPRYPSSRLYATVKGNDMRDYKRAIHATCNSNRRTAHRLWSGSLYGVLCAALIAFLILEYTFSILCYKRSRSASCSSGPSYRSLPVPFTSARGAPSAGGRSSAEEELVDDFQNRMAMLKRNMYVGTASYTKSLEPCPLMPPNLREFESDATFV